MGVDRWKGPHRTVDGQGKKWELVGGVLSCPWWVDVLFGPESQLVVGFQLRDTSTFSL